MDDAEPRTDPDAPSLARRRARTAAVVVIGLLFVVGPAFALRHERPSILGWHMFAGSPPDPVAEAVLADGRTERLDLDVLVGHFRAELDLARRLTPAICGAEPDVVAVRWSREGRSRVEEVPCSTGS